jgi:p-aminobenzoyl-glutamate transporter AbgT
MRISVRAASAAAFLIVVGFLIHNVNALWLEPTYLGFEDKAKDYGDMVKIENALWSFSFTSSGISHIVVGFSMMFLGLGVSDLFRRAHPAAARLILLSAVVSGIGFLLTGISDIPGTVYGGILRELNPDDNVTILLITTMFRGIVNVLAIAALGWFAGQVA